MAIVVVTVLIGPILIDTCNFAKDANRATVVDVEVADALEKAGSLSLERDKVFNEIVEAKSDISELTTDDLLIRDLKVTSGIPIVGLPMLVKVFRCFFLRILRISLVCSVIYVVVYNMCVTSRTLGFP